MLALYASTLFLGAVLLFLVQPMVARMVLPRLGGSPAVWNTCMVFFQTALLAGYLYAHAAPARLGLRRHAALHLALLLLPFLALPFALPAGWDVPDPDRPAPWLLAVLTLCVGPPFLAVATSAPLLQKWFAGTAHPAARDPYFLYAASNLGSMLALLGYPLLVEPALPLGEQPRLWAAGYALLVALTAGCALALWRAPAPAPPPDAPAAREETPVPAGRRARWVLLAFIPSSLMLSVTTYLTADVGSFPLFWAVPLALYLLTFILAFARVRLFPRRSLARWMPALVLVLVLVLLSEATQPMGVLMGLHLLGLVWVGLVCHGELADDRPAPGHLTEFYLWVAAGGALGGLFNALVAPVVFSSVVEYPLVLVLACLLRPALVPLPNGPAGERARRRDLLLPAGLAGLTAALVLGGQGLDLPPGRLSVAGMFALPAVLCYTFVDRPVRFALGLAGLLLAGGLYHGVYGRAEVRLRSFFGVHRVSVDPSGTYRVLVHGDTVHGQQSLDPARRREPRTYYHRTGPAGELFEALKGDPRQARVGVVGLGAGTLCCYAGPGQRWTFYEIDPAVVWLARDSGLFTYLADCPAEPDVVVGDARLMLARSPERFGVLVIDAFSSDAIPVHLLTREALRTYREHLRAGGILACNVSNRYLDLEPVVAALARDAGGSLACLTQEDLAVGPAARRDGKSPSQWVVILPAGDPLVVKLRPRGWRAAKARPGAPVWTDDYSDLVRFIRWDASLLVSPSAED